MKNKKIKEIFNQLDNIPLPDKYKILGFYDNLVNNINSTNNMQYKHNVRSSRTYKFKIVLVTCVALVIIMGSFSGYMFTVEAKEYNEAVTFFNDNNLSTEGLTRGEIKNIYRDITTGKFSYDKTAEVIEKNIGGYEIFQDEPTPKDVENLWNYMKNGFYNFNSFKKKDGIKYKHEIVEVLDPDREFYKYEKTIFTKLDNENEVWSSTLKNIIVDDYLELGNSILVYGYKPTWSSIENSYGRIILLDGDGKIIWDIDVNNGFKDEYIASILYNNNELIVFTRGDFSYLCFVKYNLMGKKLDFVKNHVGNYGIKVATRLGDGYLVQLNNYDTGDVLIKVNSDGTISDSFTYTSDNDQYYITDMIEYNNNVYLSAYSVPKLDENDGTAGGRYDIAAILNYIFDNKHFDISKEELTNLVRENFTAVLLMCDTNTGIPQEFYSVNGSLGGKLLINEDNNLQWNVESITDTFFSPATSAFTIYGASYIYKYTFDDSGKIVKQEKTEEVVPFNR